MVSAVMTDVSASAFLSFFMENTSVCFFFICCIYYPTPVKKKQDDFSGKMQNLAGLCQKSRLVYVRSYIYNLFVSLHQSC